MTGPVRSRYNLRERACRAERRLAPGAIRTTLATKVTEYWRGLGAKAINTSQPGRTRRQLEGLPDVLVWWRGHHFALECKEGRDKLRPAQEKFFEEAIVHVGEKVHVWEIKSIEDMEQQMRGAGLIC